MIGILPTYSGAVTDIKCSTSKPTFLINGVYSFLSYHQLPDLFQIGIEAKVSPNSSTVSLCVNGTSLSNNVSIECQNVIEVVPHDIDTLFRLTIQYSGKVLTHYEHYTEWCNILIFHQTQFQHHKQYGMIEKSALLFGLYQLQHLWLTALMHLTQL